MSVVIKAPMTVWQSFMDIGQSHTGQVQIVIGYVSISGRDADYIDCKATPNAFVRYDGREWIRDHFH
jgi:hypothetical protein